MCLLKKNRLKMRLTCKNYIAIHLQLNTYTHTSVQMLDSPLPVGVCEMSQTIEM